MQTAAEAWRVAATSDALGLRVHEAGKEEAISWRLQWIMPEIFGDHPAGIDETAT